MNTAVLCFILLLCNQSLSIHVQSIETSIYPKMYTLLCCVSFCCIRSCWCMCVECLPLNMQKVASCVVVMQSFAASFSSTEQAVEQGIELSAIRDAMAFMWSHSIFFDLPRCSGAVTIAKNSTHSIILKTGACSHQDQLRKTCSCNYQQ